jgi:hypothetical protein
MAVGDPSGEAIIHSDRGAEGVGIQPKGQGRWPGAIDGGPRAPSTNAMGEEFWAHARRPSYSTANAGDAHLAGRPIGDYTELFHNFNRRYSAR